MDFRTTVRAYYRLAKPGIIYGNLLTAVAGYLYSTGLDIDIAVFAGLAVGLTLTIAGACAANNYLDRGIDARMTRTKNRALVTGSISAIASLVFASVTTLTGLALVIFSQNRLTFWLVAFAWFSYVVLYGWAKRHTVHSTLIGTVPGAIPLVAGHTAVSGRIDTAAWQLFLLMAVWQMAHFYAIALYRLDDYRSAKLPVMPVTYGAARTKPQILLYIVAYLAVICWMVLTATLTIVAAAALASVATIWLYRAAVGLSQDVKMWGRKVFLFSLIVMLVMCLALVANPHLPL